MIRLCTVVMTLIAALEGVAWAADALPPAAEEARLSYSIGYQVGGDFRRQEIEIDATALVQGVQDALTGKDPVMTRDAMDRTLADLNSRIAALREESRRAQAARTLEEGKAFLEANSGRQGVVVLPSGLQYEVLVEGQGEPPGRSDTVTVHYRGTLIDGTEFDSSFRRNRPAIFHLDRVIKGWTEGLGLMRPGGKSRLTIPPDLAYGETGAGGAVGPNSTLIFEVELLSVEKGEPGK